MLSGGAQVQTIDDAWAALREGDRREAEVVASQLAESALTNHGPDTPGHASALGDLAGVLVAIGDLPRAVATLRRAASVEGVDDVSTRAQLTHLMNLGEILLAVGQTAEAVDVLTDCLARRESFYGPGHPGVAYGLQPLADAELATGALELAEIHAERAVAVFEQHAHPELAMAWVVRAEVRAARGREPLFEDASLDAIPEETLRGVVEAALRRADRKRNPVHAIAVVGAVRDQLLRRLGPVDPVHVRVLTSLANLAGLVGDHGTRLESLTTLLGLLDATGAVERAHEVVLGLALAASEAGREPETEAYYQQALERVATTSPESASRLRSQTLRNYGLWLVQVGRSEEGETLLRTATDVRNPNLRGQAHAALGVTLHHRGELEQAEAELGHALQNLPEDSPEVLSVYRHLVALREGRSCECGDGLEGLGDALQAIVRDDVPDGLVDRLTFDDRGQLQVTLLRQASDDEVAELWRVLRQGLALLRQGVRNRR